MSPHELLAGLVLGILLGIRHAFEPDHLAAVSTLVAESGSARRGALQGAFWGVGHSLSLFLVGGLLVALHESLPAFISDAFEFGVALMLVGLGGRAIIRGLRDGRAEPARLHAHGSLLHRHRGSEGHVHIGPWTLAPRPLLVGLVHGLAGTGALTALVMVQLPGTASRLVYIVCFGLGSILGMAALSGLVGLHVTRLGRFQRPLSLGTGTMSFVLGCWWGYPFLQQLW